jgi:hypothetical protein
VSENCLTPIEHFSAIAWRTLTYIFFLQAANDKVYQLLAHGRWFSPGTLASSTTNTGRHDIAEILLKVALNTKNQIKSYCNCKKNI